MTEYEKMIRGELYDPTDPELTVMRIRARKLARKYNLTDEDEPEKLTAILKELLSGSDCLPEMQAPVYFDYGANTTFGKHCAVNFGLTCLDVCRVTIGGGSVVTRDIPPHSVAAGNPCRVIRELTEADRMMR